MPRTENVRLQILSLLRATPFRRFVLNLENGDRVLIKHPGNIAFDPRANSKNDDFSIVTGRVRLFGTFDTVTSVVRADREGSVSS